MKIFFSFVVALIIVLHVSAYNLPFLKLRSSTRHYANDKDVFAALEERLQARLKQNQVQVEVLSDSTAKQGVTVSKEAVKKEAVKSATVTKQQAPPEKKQQQQTQTTQKVTPPPPPVAAKQDQKVQVQQVAASQVVVPSENKISSLEVFEGIGLGALPFILVPVVIFNSVKGLLPKPQPVTPKAPASPPAKVQPYTKSLAEGAKEGYAELASGKSTPELDDTRRAYKIVGASFAVGVATAVFSFLFNGGNSNEIAIAPKVDNKVVQVAPKRVETAKPKVLTAAPAPAPVKVVEAKKAEVKPTVPTPAPSTQSTTEEKQKVEKKQEEKVVIKSEEVKPAPTEEVKPVTDTPKVEVKPATTEPVQQKVEREDKTTVSKQVETPAKPAEKKVEATATPVQSQPATSPPPAIEKKVETEKPKPVSAPSSSATVSEKPESKVPQIEVVKVQEDSKRVVQQLQPDVVDLTKFQSLRVSASLSLSSSPRTLTTLM